uniref:Putative NAC domain-containing protein 45 n=1 Tax=Davidia involucrata TaxID=16924 RepID=A0A5B6ZNN0_DAVIN
MARTSLPPGFRFHPTDVELVKYYLQRKVMGKRFRFDAIAELNIYKFSPCDLPDKSSLQSKDREWYFFCPRERKYASGSRMSRTTENGYWKTTGKDRHINYKEQTVGMVKTLVFHQGHAPGGERTDWVMHEYRIEDKGLADAGVAQDAYVLCKIFKKSGPGPKNGAQYGAPFNEEDWIDDEEDGLFPAAPVLPSDKNSSIVTGMLIPGSTCSVSLSEAGPSNAVPSADEMPQLLQDDYDLDSKLDMFTEDDPLLSIQNNDNVKFDNFNHDKNIEAVSCVDGFEIYNGLGDLSNCSELGDGGFNFSGSQKASYAPNSMSSWADDVAFLELNDLDHPLTCPVEASGSESFPTNSLCAFNNCYNYEFQNCYPVKSFGAVHHVSGLSQPPVPPEGFNGHGDHFDVFQELGTIQENDIRESANQGCYATSYNVDFTPCKQPEEGSTCVVQDQKRGEQQRKSYSRLQHLFESIPARPASAAECFAPTNWAERSKETTLFSPYSGSSIHVKAEVTRRGGGCTKDALSDKLGESHVWCCGCDLPSSDWGKKVVKCGSGFTFVFFLGMISALMWVFIVAVFTKPGRYAWNFVLA